MVVPALAPARPGSSGPRLVRAPASAAAGVPSLDEQQRAVVAARRGSGPLVVLGAPGTGRTTTLVEAVAARVERDGVDAAEVLVLAPTRRSAADLRDRVGTRLARTVGEAPVRTPHAYAFALLRRLALAAGDAPPRLISGAEQDRVLADLLAGHAAGEGAAPTWPESVPPATRALRGFRDELRDLLMRALERGLGPEGLAEAGRRFARPQWEAAAAVLAEYLDVTAIATPGAYDPAAIVDQAVARLDADPDLLSAERRRWQLVAVDDHHESTVATARLLDRLAGQGADLLLTGDPDATTQGFRGGNPRLVATAADRYRTVAGAPATTVVLRTRHRQGLAPAAAAARVAARITSAGAVVQRSAAPAPTAAEGTVEAHVLTSAAQEGAFVAAVLREEHLRRGTGWDAMAVVVRGGGRTGSLRRALAAAAVPVRLPAAEVPVRDEPAVRPLRLALRAALRPQTLTADDAAALLLSPLGGADSLGVRRLRQALRAEERAGGGGRASDDLLLEAVLQPGRVATLPPRVARPAARLAAVLAAARAAADRDGANAESVLWALWDATGLATAWRGQALAGGPAGARADRDLDAVLALFSAAARFVDLGRDASAGRFLDQLESEDVPADTLAAHAPDEGAVHLVTPAGAAGREWDVVVVTGLQDGVWPDTRLRGSLLGAADLVDALAGRGGDPAGARRQVLDDELRMLHVAVTRARRRLVATAVRDADERPSPFLDLVAPWPGARDGDGAPPGDGAAGSDGPEERPGTPVPRAVSLPALVAELRQVLLTADGQPDGAGRRVDAGRRRAAAEALARLAAEGVPGADPASWYGLPPLSDEGPLRDGDDPVEVSPSRVEPFLRCSLRWLLETSGGTAGSTTQQGVGNLVHEVAAELPSGTEEELLAALDRRWSSLGLRPGWAADRERRRAQDMLRRLARYVASSDRAVVDTELSLQATLGRAVVRGRVDRLERDADGALVVVDLKTGSSKPRDEEVGRHPQLGVYQLGIEAGGLPEHGARSGGAALVHVGAAGGRHDAKVQHQQPPRTADDPDWAAALLAEVADGMAGATFTATVNDMCRTCPVRSACPVQPEGRPVAAS